jgi:hypothetical protein
MTNVQEVRQTYTHREEREREYPESMGPAGQQALPPQPSYMTDVQGVRQRHRHRHRQGQGRETECPGQMELVGQ